MTEEYTPFYCVSRGNTKAEAALDLVNEMMDKLPKDAGYYDLLIRTPLEYGTDENFITGKTTHQYYFRGSYILRHKKEGFAGLPLAIMSTKA